MPTEAKVYKLNYTETLRVLSSALSRNFPGAHFAFDVEHADDHGAEFKFNGAFNIRWEPGPSAQEVADFVSIFTQPSECSEELRAVISDVLHLSVDEGAFVQFEMKYVEPFNTLHVIVNLREDFVNFFSI